MVEKAAFWSLLGALGRFSWASSLSNFLPFLSPFFRAEMSVSVLFLGTTRRKSSNIATMLASTPTALAIAMTAYDCRCAMDVQEDPPKGKYGLNQ